MTFVCIYFLPYLVMGRYKKSFVSGQNLEQEKVIWEPDLPMANW